MYRYGYSDGKDPLYNEPYKGSIMQMMDIMWVGVVVYYAGGLKQSILDPVKPS